MKRSDFFMPMRRQMPRQQGSGATAKNDVYLQQHGYIAQVGAGIYTHLPAGYKLFRNVKKTLSKYLLRAGCSEHQFPAIQPTAIWKESGRFETFGKIMFNFEDQHGRNVSLAPTHEVIAALTAKQFIHSYRDLPVRINQVQTKFRDETRPRGGVMRTREFTMQDLYSFDTGPETAKTSYDAVVQAYRDTLVDLRVPFCVKVQNDMGSIGGLESHEFHVLSPSGEDIYDDPHNGPQPSIEIAHTFSLGDTYTKPINAVYAGSDGAERFIYMCSFGMGIERTAAAYIEKYLQESRDLVWSWSLAPFPIVVLGARHKDAWRAYEQLLDTGYDVLIEDRTQLSFSQQWKESLLLGAPLYVIFGKKFASEERVEIYTPRTKSSRFVAPEDLLTAVVQTKKETEAIEVIEMNFPLISISSERKLAVVSLTNPIALLSNSCRLAEIGADLLGNFDKQKASKPVRRLKAGEYWLLPVIESPGESCQRSEYCGVEYFNTSSIAEFLAASGLSAIAQTDKNLSL
jgi:prolyl-tRNA synthetase